MLNLPGPADGGIRSSFRVKGKGICVDLLVFVVFLSFSDCVRLVSFCWKLVIRRRSKPVHEAQMDCLLFMSVCCCANLDFEPCDAVILVKIALLAICCFHAIFFVDIGHFIRFLSSFEHF